MVARFMDFLDPKAKRRHTITLIIGYGLMAVLIGIATFILVYSAYGFDVDRKTGQVIQNGLVFVDSAPDAATIRFNNDVQKDRTNSRFALPSGQYDLQIQKTEYREWRRKFELKGGAVERFTYPMLILNNLSPQQLVPYTAMPRLTTQSPDRRWLLLADGNALSSFTEYDLNTVDNNEQPQQRTFSVPSDLLSQGEGVHLFELVEWSNDNKHFLIKHSYATGSEFVIISRDNPAESININRLLNQNPTKITLRDKKYDQWYLYTAEGGVLQTGDTKKVITPVLTNVSSFKSHDTDTLLYAQPTADGKYQRVTLIQDGKEPYVVKDVPNGAVMLDIARYDSNWYVVVGVDAEKKAYVYRNPLTVLQKKDGTKPTPRSVLKLSGPLTQVSFSKNTRFIMAQSGQQFAVHDAEYNRNYNYTIAQPLDPAVKVDWMDGHRLLGRSNGNAVMFDFDGMNLQSLVPFLPAAPVVFDRDYTVVYSINGINNDTGKPALFSTQLRLEADK